MNYLVEDDTGKLSVVSSQNPNEIEAECKEKKLILHGGLISVKEAKYYMPELILEELNRVLLNGERLAVE